MIYDGIFASGITAASSRFADLLSPARMANPDSAEYLCVSVVRNIMEFQNGLDSEHEVMIQLAQFGESIKIAVDNIRAENPNMLVFEGFVGESRVTLIQSVHQLNFLLMSTARADPTKPAKKIGFVFPTETERSQGPLQFQSECAPPPIPPRSDDYHC